MLLTLWETDGLSLRAIGDRLGLDSGTLTPLLKRMEAGGFVRRSRARTDERQVLVSLTGEGRRLEAVAAAFPQQVFNRSGCSTEDLGALRRMLVALRDQIGAPA